MKLDIIKEIELEKEVTAQADTGFLKVKGPKGEVERNFLYPKVSLMVENNKIILKSFQATKREKKIVGSFEAHIKNMIKGVKEPHVYKIKICSGHFPMNVSVSGKDFTIKNFLGEAVPRRLVLVNGVEVKVNGTEIIVSSPDKEIAGKVAGQIEKLCRITGLDKRIFQDGCYIIHKSGKDLL